jgi:protein-S-isoprenylcysteine O-methyltransferase Ste14
MPWFRRAQPAATSALLLRTLVQLTVFWGVFLFIVPPVLARLERSLAPGVAFSSQGAVAAAIFLVASALGLGSAWTMVTVGRGTPLPLDGPRELVARGPYAVVRNPMAVAGLAQGAAVGLWLGSWLVLAYVVVGGVLWHVFVRPVEEADLLATFGEAYRGYRTRVPLWLPRMRRS